MGFRSDTRLRSSRCGFGLNSSCADVVKRGDDSLKGETDPGAGRPQDDPSLERDKVTDDYDGLEDQPAEWTTESWEKATHSYTQV